jgi:hypothetical protein
VVHGLSARVGCGVADPVLGVRVARSGGGGDRGHGVAGRVKRSELKRKTPLKRSGPIKASAPRAGKVRAPIAAQSTKTTARDREYAKLRRVWLGIPGESTTCEGFERPGWWPAAGSCSRWATEVHHGRGRGRFDMLDVGTWHALCGPCHRWATGHPLKAKNAGLSEGRNETKGPAMTAKLKGKCRSCFAPIYWGSTGEASIPLDADPATGDPLAIKDPPAQGRIQEVARESDLFTGETSRVVVRVLAQGDEVNPELPVWRSHFATCKFAKDWKR